jgi:hypothetical protein
MLVHLFLAAASGNSAAAGATILNYILGSIAIIVAGMIGIWHVFARQRKKWVDEGSASASALKAQIDNTNLLKQNTEAIARLNETQMKLSVQLGEFTTSVHTELNGLGKRITRLEFFSAVKKGDKITPDDLP